jgi:hypothetical protein
MLAAGRAAARREHCRDEPCSGEHLAREENRAAQAALAGSRVVAGSVSPR